MGKCKYWKRCPKYDKGSVTCDKNAGMYYGIGSLEERGAGCYREMQEKEDER